MRVGVVGINHKLADLKLRETLAKVCQRRFGPGQSTHGSHSFILLSTCNRTEVYFASEDLAQSHSYFLSVLNQEVDEDFDQKLYSYFGKDCFLHLARVTAGLDSAVVAETEIQGQVKNAYENASEYTHLPSEMHFVFQKALSIGKKVRSELPMQRGIPGLEDAVFNCGKECFDLHLQAKILFVGASEINLKILSFFRERGCTDITLCNRSYENCLDLPLAKEVKLMEWRKMASWSDFDWIIFGTKSPDYILRKEHLPLSLEKQKLIIDLCVPRNVEPALGRQKKVYLYNIDHLNNTLQYRRKQLLTTLGQAEERVISSVQQHTYLFRQKDKNRQQILAVV